MPRFVILWHDLPPGQGRGAHWDFMLELDGRLRTWAFSNLPGPGETVAGRALPDHRLEYLDYEGPVSGERGSVTRFDRGEYELIGEEDQELIVALRGERRSGRVVLRRLKQEEWSLSF